MAGAGYIYIMTNKSFNREDWIKIGYTTNLTQRLKSLSNTGLPYDYELYAYYEVPSIDHMQDKALHNLIVKLNPKMRLVKNREFFEITPQDAYEVLDLMATIHGTKDKLHKCSVDSISENYKPNYRKIEKDSAQNISINKEKVELANDTVFYCTGNGANAFGKLIEGGAFLILTGSKISKKTTPSLYTNKRSYYDLRERLISEESICDYTFAKDIAFKSPSAASCIVLGRSSNGMIDWKTKDGHPIRDFLLKY